MCDSTKNQLWCKKKLNKTRKSVTKYTIVMKVTTKTTRANEKKTTFQIDICIPYSTIQKERQKCDLKLILMVQRRRQSIRSGCCVCSLDYVKTNKKKSIKHPKWKTFWHLVNRCRRPFDSVLDILSQRNTHTIKSGIEIEIEIRNLVYGKQKIY